MSSLYYKEVECVTLFIALIKFRLQVDEEGVCNAPPLTTGKYQ